MEVLVALFVITIISTSGATILMRSADSREAMADVTRRVSDISQTHALIRDDLAQWVPREFQGRNGLDPVSIFMGGTIAERGLLFAFVRDGWLNPNFEQPRSGLINVRYVVEEGKLLRKVELTPDAVQGSETLDQVLLEGVTSYRVEFRQGDFWVPQWQSGPGQPIGAPVAVRLELGLENGRSFEWLFITPAGGLLS